jgi:hypothetical protein
MVQIIAPTNPVEQKQDKYSPNFASLVMGTPSLMTNESEKIRTNKMRNDEANQFLQGDFTVGEDLTDAWFKFDLAKSKTLTAKQQKFVNKYPNGVLTQITLPSTNEVKLVYKKEPTDKFRFLDIGVNYPEIMGAVASGEMIGGILGSRFGIGGTGVGTAVGSLAETGVEKVRGYDVPTLKEEGIEAVKEGGIATVFDAGTRGAIKTFKALASGGISKSINTSDFADSISKFAQDEFLKPLAIGQLAKRPVIFSTFTQVGQTGEVVGNLTKQQVLSLKNSIGKITDDFNPKNFSEVELDAILKLQQDDLLKQVTSKFKTGTLSESFENSNSALSKGIENWKELSRVKRNKLYDTAINSSDDFSFDLSDMQNVAKQMQRAIIMKQKPSFQNKVVGTGLTDEGVETAITKSQKLPDKYKDVQNIPQEIQKEIDLILGLDPSVAKIQYKGQTFQPFEQMKALRTRLFNLQQSDNKNISRLASDLYKSLKGVMDNPLTGSEDALQLYKEASAFNLYRETTLKVPIISKILKSSNPEDVVKNNFSNTQPSEVKLIKSLVSPEKFTTLKNAYVYQMLNDTTSLNKFVKNIQLNKDTTKLIFNDDQIKSLQQYHKSISKLDSSKLSQAVSKDVSNFERMVLISNEGYDSLKTLIQNQGGKNSKFIQSLKAGMYKKILDDATVQDPKGGTEFIDLGKLYAGMDKIYKNKNIMELVFSPEDVAKLENYGLYARLVDRSSDVGGQIQIGELASSLATPLKPAKFTGALIKIGQNDFIAKILSQPYKASSKEAYKKSNFLNENRLKELSILINRTNQQLNDKDRKTKVLFNQRINRLTPIRSN